MWLLCIDMNFMDYVLIWKHAQNIFIERSTEEERREKLAGNYADYLAEKYNTSVVLYGCNERGEI